MTNKVSRTDLLKTLFLWIKVLFSSFVVSVAIVSQASAHMMVAQHGTLNVKDNGVYMMLSLPVSSFEDIDDDGDGKMSSSEYNKHKPNIISTVNKKVKLSNSEGLRPLQGLLIIPVVPHEPANAPADQLVIMGRFSLDKTKTENNKNLTFEVTLFGQNATEKNYTISAKRKSKTSVDYEKDKFKVTPQQSKRKLFKHASL